MLNRFLDQTRQTKHDQTWQTKHDQTRQTKHDQTRQTKHDQTWQVILVHSFLQRTYMTVVKAR